MIPTQNNILLMIKELELLKQQTENSQAVTVINATLNNLYKVQTMLDEDF